jgi:hypothetical protein
MTANANTGLAYDFTATLAGLVKSYATTSQLKKDYKSLVNLYGKDEAVRLMKAYKARKENEVSNKADESREQLTVAGLMEYAFNRLDLKKKNGALAQLQKMGGTDRAASWEAFIAKYYPHTMEDGRPASAVWYARSEHGADLCEVYKVYEPLTITTETAIKILNRALDSLERGAKRVWSNDKPRLVWSVAHKAGAICEIREARVVREIMKNEEGEVVSDKFTIERGDKKELREGLCIIADEFTTCKELLKSLNSENE